MALRALITGITGQDGSYLSEFLLARGYEVHGMVRRDITESQDRMESLRDRVTLHQADLSDQLSLMEVLIEAQPQEVYNLAALSFVPTSWNQPVITGESNALGVNRILEAIRLVDPQIRFYQASSSEMFGNTRQEPQNEQTPLMPYNPYGVAKTYGHWITTTYRNRFGMFACSGILYNHESPLRGKEYVTRKVTDAVARIKLGAQQRLELGNLDAERDWGFAGDFVESMWLMLQQEKPEDFVIATGKKHSVRQWVERAFAHVGLNWEEYVDLDPALQRKGDIHSLRGDIRLAKQKLGWQPKVEFSELVAMMVDADLKVVQREMSEGKLNRTR